MWGVLSVLAICLWGLAQSERAGHATQQRLVGWGAPLSPGGMGILPTPGPTRKLPERGSLRPGWLRETPRTTRLDEGVGFCRIDGLLLFQGAVWSPQPCTVCACEAGAAICEHIECPALRCKESRRLDGQCCAVCVPNLQQGTATSKGVEAALNGSPEHISIQRKEGKRAPEARGDRRDAEKREPAGRKPSLQARGRKLAKEHPGGPGDRASLRETRPSTKPREGALRQRGAASRVSLRRPKAGLKALGHVGGESGIKGPGVGLKGPEVGLKNIEVGLKKAGLKSLEVDLKKLEVGLKKVGLKSPALSLMEPDVGMKEPEVGLTNPEVGPKSPDVDLKSPEFSLKEPDVSLKSPEVGQKKLEVGLKKVGLKSPELSLKEPVVGMKEPEVGLKKAGLKSPESSLKEPNVGMKEPEVGLKKPEVGLKKAGVKSPELSLKKPDTSLKSPEVGLKKLEVGLKKVGLKSPALSQKEPNVGLKSPEVGLKKPDVGLKSPERGPKKPEAGLKTVVRAEGKVGLTNLTAGLNKPEVSLKNVGLKKPEPEVGLKLLEVGLKRAEDDLETPEAGDQKLKRGLGVKKLDGGRKKPNVGQKATKVGTRQDTAQRRRAEGRGSARAQNTRPGKEQAGRGEPETAWAEVARKQARKIPGARRDAKESEAGGASSPVPFPQELLPPPESELGAPSLPVGCILAENAIACPASKLTEIPKLVDPGLQTLYLAENDIRSVSASDFTGVPNLQWLDLSRNRIAGDSLEKDAFRNLTKLRRLNLDGNRIDHVPCLPASLKELKMNDNRLQGLRRHSFRGLHQLLTLDLEGNGLNDGNVNPSTLRPLTNLLYLRLGRNRFRAMPSGLPPALKELHLEDNRIEEIPSGLLNKTLNLTILILRNNHLEETRIDPRAWIHLRKLEMLDLSYNRLVHVPSFLPIGVRQLLLPHNRIERIPGYVFAHLDPGLEFLHLSHNRLQRDGIHTVSFLGLQHSLHELLLDNNQLRQIPRGILSLRALQVLRLSDNHISEVPLDSVCDTRISEDSSLVSVHLENNLIDRRLIPPTAFSCIRSYQSVILRPQRNEP